MKTVSVAAPDTAVESHKTEDALIKMEKKGKTVDVFCIIFLTYVHISPLI